jgi:tetratricopeptide (TPR) repeat protein
MDWPRARLCFGWVGCYAHGVRVNFNELRESLLALLETGQVQMALRTVQHVMKDLHNQSVWQELRDVLNGAVGQTSLSQEPWLVQYAQVLRGCRDTTKILEISRNSHNPLVRLERAWALVISEEFVEARGILQEIMPGLTGIPLGFAYRCLTSIEFGQGKDWRETWQQVRSRLGGRALGIALLDEAFQFAKAGDEVQARSSAMEAAALLEHDPFHFAWAQHSIGMSYLRENHILQAENALIESEQLSRQRRAQAFRARALCGVGSLRRTQGHLSMAETQYRLAVKFAQESDDLIEALWGVGHCLRLQGQPERALEQFKRALRVNIASNWIEVHRALALLMLERTDEAQKALERAGQVHGATVQRVRVARAELARLQGHDDLARQGLQDLPSSGLAAREESRIFPALFGLLEFPTMPSNALEHHVIEVQADRTSVRINGRTLTIKPNVNSTQLLSTLLEHGGTLDIQTLVQSIWPGVALEHKRKQLWRTVQQLRECLGWRNAVVALEDAYQLDPNADWR